MARACKDPVLDTSTKITVVPIALIVGCSNQPPKIELYAFSAVMSGNV